MTEEPGKPRKYPRRMLMIAGVVLLVGVLLFFLWMTSATPRVVARIPLSRSPKSIAYPTDAGLVIGDGAGHCSLYAWSTGKRVWSITYHPTPLSRGESDLQVSASGRYLVVMTDEGIAVWDHGRPMPGNPHSVWTMNSVRIFDTGAVYTWGEGVFSLLRPKQGWIRCPLPVPAGAKYVRCDFSPDGRYCAVEHDAQTTVYAVAIGARAIRFVPQYTVKDSIYTSYIPGPFILQHGMLVTGNKRVYDHAGHDLAPMKPAWIIGSTAQDGSAVCLHETAPAPSAPSIEIERAYHVYSLIGGGSWSVRARPEVFGGGSSVSSDGRYLLVEEGLSSPSRLMESLQRYLPFGQGWFEQQSSRSRICIYERPGFLRSVINTQWCGVETGSMSARLGGVRYYNIHVASFAPTRHYLLIFGSRTIGEGDEQPEYVLLRW